MRWIRMRFNEIENEEVVASTLHQLFLILIAILYLFLTVKRLSYIAEKVALTYF